MAQVTMPDGAVVEMPEKLSPELGARLRKFQESKAAPAKSATSFGQEVAGAYVEPALAMGSSMIAKPVGDIAGLAATAADFVTGNKDSKAQDFQRHVQESLTYEPKTKAGKAITEYNPLALAGRAIDYVGGGAEKLVNKMPVPEWMEPVREAQSRAIGEGVRQAPALLGVKAGQGVAKVRNLPAETIGKALESPIAKEGAELMRENKMDLTLGQQTGSKALLFFENAARQSWLTGDKVMAGDQAQAIRAIKRVEEIASDISPTDSSSGAVGTRIQTATRDAVESIDRIRRTQADADYGKVRQLAQGQPVIRYDNLASKWKEIADRYRDVGGSDARAVVKQAEAELKAIMEAQQRAEKPSGLIGPDGKPFPAPEPVAPNPKTVSIDAAMRTRRSYGEAARATGNVFKDIDRTLDRKLAGELFGAVERDFVAAESSGKPYSQALKEANANYRSYSDSIRFVENSVLGKLVGKDLADAAFSGQEMNTVAGERVTQQFLKMTPSEARVAAGILNRTNPQVLSEVKAFVLRDALKSGMDIPPSAGAKAIPISYNKFIKSLPDAEHLEAMGFTKGEIRKIDRIVDHMVRLGDRSGYNASQTAPVHQFLEMFASPIRRGASTIAQATVLNGIAKSMVSEEGRQALLTVTRPRPRPEEAIAAWQVIRSNMESKDNEQRR